MIVSRKQSMSNFPKNKKFLPPWYAHLRTCVYQEVKNVRFSENLTCFVFLKHPFWDSPLYFITEAETIREKTFSYSIFHSSITSGAYYFQIWNLSYVNKILIFQELLPLPRKLIHTEHISEILLMALDWHKTVYQKCNFKDKWNKATV